MKDYESSARFPNQESFSKHKNDRIATPESSKANAKLRKLSQSTNKNGEVEIEKNGKEEVDREKGNSRRLRKPMVQSQETLSDDDNQYLDRKNDHIRRKSSNKHLKDLGAKQAVDQRSIRKLRRRLNEISDEDSFSEEHKDSYPRRHRTRIPAEHIEADPTISYSNRTLEFHPIYPESDNSFVVQEEKEHNEPVSSNMIRGLAESSFPSSSSSKTLFVESSSLYTKNQLLIDNINDTTSASNIYKCALCFRTYGNSILSNSTNHASPHNFANSSTINPLITPRLLPCGHTFCSICLQNRISTIEMSSLSTQSSYSTTSTLSTPIHSTSTSKYLISCPHKCYPDQPLPSNNAEHLPINEQLMEALKFLELFDQQNRLRAHETTPSAKSTAQQSNISGMQEFLYCKDHSQPLSLFCRKCRHFVCVYCTSPHIPTACHINHPIDSLEQFTSQLQSQSQFVARMKSKCTEIEQQKTLLEQKHRQSESVLFQINNDIRATFQSLRSEIDRYLTERETLLLKQSGTRLTKINEKFYTDRNKLAHELNHSQIQLVKLSSFSATVLNSAHELTSTLKAIIPQSILSFTSTTTLKHRDDISQYFSLRCKAEEMKIVCDTLGFQQADHLSPMLNDLTLSKSLDKNPTNVDTDHKDKEHADIHPLFTKEGELFILEKTKDMIQNFGQLIIHPPCLVNSKQTLIKLDVVLNWMYDRSDEIMEVELQQSFEDQSAFRANTISGDHSTKQINTNSKSKWCQIFNYIRSISSQFNQSTPNLPSSFIYSLGFCKEYQFRLRARNAVGWSTWKYFSKIQLPSKQCIHSFDLDCNGIIHCIGNEFYNSTHEKLVSKTKFLNPCTDIASSNHPIKLYSSALAMASAPLPSITGRVSSTVATISQTSAYIMFDLGHVIPYRIIPTSYTIVNASRGGHKALRNWRLEGRFDDSDLSEDVAIAAKLKSYKTDWVILKEHLNDSSMQCETNSVKTWEISSEWSKDAGNDKLGFRYIRIVSKGINAGGDEAIIIGGLELYGVLYRNI